MDVLGRLTCRQFPGAGSGLPPSGRRWPEKRQPGRRHRAAVECPTQCLARGQKSGTALRGRPSCSTAASSLPACPRPSPGGGLTCEHAGEEHGREVVVEVEDPAHEEEGEVVECPAQQQLTASSQQDLGQPCPRRTAPISAGRGRDPGLQPSSAPSLLCDINRPPHLLGLLSLGPSSTPPAAGRGEEQLALKSPAHHPPSPVRPQHPQQGCQTPAKAAQPLKKPKSYTLHRQLPTPPLPTSLLPHRCSQR